MMLKKMFALAVAVAVGCGAVAGCTPSSATPSAGASSSNAVDHVAVTYVKSPLNVPSITERKTGAFAAAGLDVTYSELTTGPEQTAALASGDIQFLFAVGATSVILSAANGADIAILGMYSRAPEAFTLVSAAGGPTTPAGLVGKTIGGPKGTILHELLLAYLASGGYTADDVHFVDMAIPAAQAALTGGSIDVALLAGPAASTMLADGYQKVTDGRGLVGASIVVATSRTYATKHPDVVKKFTDAQRSVLAYMDAHPDEALAATAAETGLSDAAVRAMYPMYDFSMDVTDADIASMQKTEKFMLDTKMIDQAVDITGLILPTK